MPKECADSEGSQYRQVLKKYQSSGMMWVCTNEIILQVLLVPTKNMKTYLYTPLKLRSQLHTYYHEYKFTAIIMSWCYKQNGCLGRQ